MFVSLRTHSAVDEAVDLEATLDETIVETTWKRRTYPKQILPHVVHALKAERKLMVGVRRWRWRGRCVPVPCSDAFCVCFFRGCMSKRSNLRMCSKIRLKVLASSRLT